MRNATKLLAFVLAFVMVLSMVPMASAQTVHTHGIEEYPEIFANEEVLVSIGEPLVSLTADLPSEHNYVGEVTKEATCTECGDSYTEIIPGTGEMYDYTLYGKTVVIEEGAVSVGAFAFVNCSNLTAVFHVR